MLGLHLKPKPYNPHRRKTCHYCGEKGHVQAACPFKRAAETLRTKDEDVSRSLQLRLPVDHDANVVNRPPSIAKSSKRRRSARRTRRRRDGRRRRRRRTRKRPRGQSHERCCCRVVCFFFYFNTEPWPAISKDHAVVCRICVGSLCTSVRWFDHLAHLLHTNHPALNICHAWLE